MGELLLRRGATGYVRDVGSFLQDEIIYSVDFIEYGYRVGCREQELLDASEPWVPSRYEFRDKVTLAGAISVKGELVAAAGTCGEIMKVLRDLPTGVHYHFNINGRIFLVPEDMLTGESDLDERVAETKSKGVDTEGKTRGATLPWQGLR